MRSLLRANTAPISVHAPSKEIGSEPLEACLFDTFLDLVDVCPRLLLLVPESSVAAGVVGALALPLS